jgi:hypothetical protein
VSLRPVIGEQTQIHRIVIENIWQVKTDEELCVQMIVVRINGQVANMFLLMNPVSGMN